MSSKKKTVGRAAKKKTQSKPAKKIAKSAPKSPAKAAKKIAKKAGKKSAPKAPAKAAKVTKKVAKKPAKKSAPKPKPVKRAAKSVTRRDAAGHIDPKYAAELRARGREEEEHDDDRAFVDGSHSSDPLAEEMGEEFVETVTSGEDEGNELRDQRITEELGGPFVESTGSKEYARGSDPSNPKDGTREPFPKT